MEIILPIIYIILLILALAFSGVIVYHILKYRQQLPKQESQRAFAWLVTYLIAGAAVLLLSMISAGILAGISRLVV